MYVISLLVHENKEVILDQLLNFKKYFPQAVVLIHLSKGASFNIDDLDNYLKTKVDNFILNPIQEETSWGNIFKAYISNIKLAYEIFPNGKILFHSSNDMFVRRGVENYCNDKEYLFNYRLIKPKDFSYWWPANSARQDIKLKNILDYLGCEDIVGTQIEGSLFLIESLIEVINIIERYNFLDSKIFYPKEEIIFSTILSALGVTADGLPYVFSEVHRFDRYLWNIYKKYPISYKNKIFNKIIFNVLLRSNIYKLSKSDVYNIINNNFFYFKNLTKLNDGEREWEIFYKEEIFAVKRVMRRIYSLRKFINFID